MVVGLAAGGPGLRPGMHSVDYSMLVRSADWRRPATVRACLLPWRAAQRSAAVGASVHTANARCAAGPSEPTPQIPSLATAPALQRDGEGAFRGAAGPGYRVRDHSISRGKRSPGATACWETGNTEIPARCMDQLLVERRCTLTRPQKRGVTRMEDAPAHPHDSNTDRSSGWHRAE